jgi:CRISPR-associated exonuclease Cas4
MFTEDHLLPLSALQHLVFCERQCALIHLEQLWKDNAFTLEGSHLHGRVDGDAPHREVRGDLVILRGLALRSLELGLVGRADVVELHRAASAGDRSGRPVAVSVCGLRGLWTPFPVEYKRGKPKADSCDKVQLCAQALCLEEMMNVHVPEGALFYGRRQQRYPVELGDELRRETCDAARRLHELISAGVTPPATKEPKCRRCSLLPICMPEAMSRGRSARRYVEASVFDALENRGGDP